MIITPVLAPGWTSLARRGMLWSEVQVFDVSVLAADCPGPGLDPDCHELLYCAAGSASLAAPDRPVLRLLAGQCLAIGPRQDGQDAVTITAGGRGATVVRVRALPASTSRRLAPRWPSLDRDPA